MESAKVATRNCRGDAAQNASAAASNAPSASLASPEASRLSAWLALSTIGPASAPVARVIANPAAAALRYIPLIIVLTPDADDRLPRHDRIFPVSGASGGWRFPVSPARA